MVWEYAKKVLAESGHSAVEWQGVFEILFFGVLFLLPNLLQRIKRKTPIPVHEKSLRHIFLWKFLHETEWRIFITVIAFLILHTLIFAPYHVYRETKSELKKIAESRNRVISWHGPEISPDIPSLFLMFGGHYELEPTMLVGQPIPIDVRKVRANKEGLPIKICGLPAITARSYGKQIYFDLDVPTYGKIIQMRDGESGTLPDGWDWNYDSDSLEIVDDQNRAVFQELYRTNIIWMKGAIQCQGQLLVSRSTGYLESVPHAFYDPSQLELTPIFKYPSSRYPSMKLK